MEAEILKKAVAGSFGVTRCEEVAAVRQAVARGWINALVCTASSHAPIESTHTALVLSLTPEGLQRLQELQRTSPVHAH